jgi:RNA polymerase-binding transcription factor DksA
LKNIVITPQKGGNKLKDRMQIFRSRDAYFDFLRQTHARELKEFNESPEENKSKKWHLLRVEKVIRLIEKNPQYQIGTCFTCGERIPRDRLLAQPQSIWCHGCATEHEQANRHRGGHWKVREDRIKAIARLLGKYGLPFHVVGPKNLKETLDKIERKREEEKKSVLKETKAE